MAVNLDPYLRGEMPDHETKVYLAKIFYYPHVCENCGTETSYDAGHNQTQDDPGQSPAMVCPNCALEHPVPEYIQILVNELLN